jgi:hypothetical protein
MLSAHDAVDRDIRKQVSHLGADTDDACETANRVLLTSLSLTSSVKTSTVRESTGKRERLMSVM